MGRLHPSAPVLGKSVLLVEVWFLMQIMILTTKTLVITCSSRLKSTFLFSHKGLVLETTILGRIRTLKD